MSGQPKRLTATQVWHHLSLMQREAVLNWFVSSYAPGGAGKDRVLSKTPILTHANSIIMEKWQGVDPRA